MASVLGSRRLPHSMHTWCEIGGRVQYRTALVVLCCMCRPRACRPSYLEQSATQHSWLVSHCQREQLQHCWKLTCLFKGHGAGVFELARQKCTLWYDMIWYDMIWYDFIKHIHLDWIAFDCSVPVLSRSSRQKKENAFAVLLNHWS